MNKKMFSFIVGILFFSGINESLSAYHVIAEPLPLELQAWSQGNRHFTGTFYSEANHKNGNLVFSPLSLQMAIGMAAELALGETQQEMLSAASLPDNDRQRSEGALQILSQVSMNGEETNHRIALANSAWLSSRIEMTGTFTDVLFPFYQAEHHLADFQLFPAKMTHAINAWVSEKTWGKIQNLLPQGSITELTSLVIVNTLYMKAPWEHPFDSKLTFEAPFFGADTQSVSYMRRVGYLCILDESLCIVLEIPFENSAAGKLALYIVMPHNGYSLEDIAECMTPLCMEHWLRDAEFKHVDLRLPKFKVSSTVNARRILQGLGMEKAFVPAAAEFDLHDPNGNVYVSDIFHQAVFEIDEEGGTGAAATGVVMTTKSFQQSRVIEINQPFLFFVAEKRTGVIHFAGHVINPEG